MYPKFNTRHTILPDATSDELCLTFLRTLVPQISLYERLTRSQWWSRGSKNGGCKEKQPLASLFPLVLQLKVVPRPGQRESPTRQYHQLHRVGVISPKKLPCAPRHPPETSRGNGIYPLEDTRQARTNASPAAHTEEERMEEAANGM